MDNVPLRASAFVVGGLFIGAWLFLALFETPNLHNDRHAISTPLWVFWGIVGLVIAGGIYAGRVARPALRMAIWVVMGIAVGMLAMAALFYGIGEALAALLTFGGGAIIVTGLPNPPGAVEAEPYVDPQEMQQARRPARKP